MMCGIVFYNSIEYENNVPIYASYNLQYYDADNIVAMNGP